MVESINRQLTMALSIIQDYHSLVIEALESSLMTKALELINEQESFLLKAQELLPQSESAMFKHILPDVIETQLKDVSYGKTKIEELINTLPNIVDIDKERAIDVKRYDLQIKNLTQLQAIAERTNEHEFKASITVEIQKIELQRNGLF